MRSGDRILGIAVLQEELAASGELRRWAATDTRDGTSKNVVTPGRMAKLRPGAEARFRDAYSNRPAHPAVLACSGYGIEEGYSLGLVEAHLPYSSPTLDPDQAESLLHWLIPGVVCCASALGGELDATDLVQLPNGQVMLSPSGVIRASSVSRLPIHLPPEATLEALAPTAESALYGLGVVVFTALTGEPPVQARTIDQLRSGQEHPRQLRQLLPSASGALDSLLTALLHPDPTLRLEISRSLPTVEAAPLLPRAQPVKRVEKGSREHLVKSYSHHSIGIKKWTLLLRPPAPNRAALRRMIGTTDLFPVRVLEALGAGVPVPLASFAEKAEAQALMDRISESDAELEILFTGHRSQMSLLLAASGLAGAATSAALVAGSALLGPAGVGLALCLSAGGVSSLGLLQHSRQMKALQTGMRLGHARIQIPEAVATVRGHLQAARRAVNSPDLPDLIRLDFNASLDGLQDELEALFSLTSSELQIDPAHGRLIAVEQAARQILDAASRTGAGSAQETSQAAIRQAEAAAAALTED